MYPLRSTGWDYIVIGASVFQKLETVPQISKYSLDGTYKLWRDSNSHRPAAFCQFQ